MSRCRGTVSMLSRFTTDGRGKPSGRPTDISVGSPRAVRVTRATTIAPIESTTAFLVSTTTGRGPTGGGNSAHQISALRIVAELLLNDVDRLDVTQLLQELHLRGGYV